MRLPGPVDGQNAGPVAGRAVEVDLGIALDRDARTPLPDQLERTLRLMLGRRQLLDGQRLPSTRALSRELGVSRGVVVEAYDRLARQGLLEVRQGAAVRVASGVLPDAPNSTSLLVGDDPATDVARRAAPRPAAAIGVSLHPALTPPATFDRRAWGAAIRRVLRTASETDLRTVDHRGLLALRTALIEQLTRSRGIAAGSDQVFVTSGVTHALTTLAPFLRERGPIAVEDPGFLLHRATLVAAGLEVVPVTADADGLDVGALEASGVRTVLLTPAHQMPLGTPLSTERRGELVRWAEATDGLVLEDDYDGELRYDRRSVRAVQALDPKRVIYLGTTSKVLSPAVRIGWMLVPHAHLDWIGGLQGLSGGAPSNVDQLALSDLLTSGAFDRSVARLRRRCATQRAALVEALSARGSLLEPLGVEAGLVLTLRAAGIDAARFWEAAAPYDLDLFAVADGADLLLTVGFGDVHESAAPAIAALLDEVIANAAHAD